MYLINRLETVFLGWKTKEVLKQVGFNRVRTCSLRRGLPFHLFFGSEYKNTIDVESRYIFTCEHTEFRRL